MGTVTKPDANTMADIEAGLRRLATLDLQELREAWELHYACRAPLKMSRQLLALAIGYRIQELACGGLGQDTRQKLAAIGRQTARPGGQGGERPGERGGERANAGKPPAPRIRYRFRYKPGTRLLREWQGVTHEVVVVEDGDFIHDGRRYRSLSHIARTITGTNWSGPAFFGIRPSPTTAGVSGGDRNKRRAGNDRTGDANPPEEVSRSAAGSGDSVIPAGTGGPLDDPGVLQTGFEAALKHG